MEEVLRARVMPNGIVRRVKAVLLLSEGASLRSTRAVTGLNLRHIVKWRERFAAEGLEGLVDQPRSGRPNVSASRGKNAFCAIRCGPNRQEEEVIGRVA
jgi:hypothetical protein